MSSEKKYYESLVYVIKHGNLEQFIIDNPGIFKDDIQYQLWLTNLSNKISEFGLTENIEKLVEKLNSTRAKIKEETDRLKSNKLRRENQLVQDARISLPLSDEDAMENGPEFFLDNAIKLRKQKQNQLTQQLEELQVRLDGLVTGSQIPSVSDIANQHILSKIISISEEMEAIEKALKEEKAKKDEYINEIIEKHIDTYYRHNGSTGVDVIKKKLLESLPKTWDLSGGKKNRKTKKSKAYKKSKTYKKVKRSSVKRSKTYKKSSAKNYKKTKNTKKH